MKRLFFKEKKLFSNYIDCIIFNIQRKVKSNPYKVFKDILTRSFK